MSLSSLLDGDGKDILHRSGFGKGHLGEGGLDMKASSHGLELTKKLRQQMVATSRV